MVAEGDELRRWLGGVAPVEPGSAAGPAADRAPYYRNDLTPCRYDLAQLIADLEDAQAPPGCTTTTS
ncbi:MAG: hypothetical protein ACXWEI_11130 [Mycobacterium sp.]